MILRPSLKLVFILFTVMLSPGFSQDNRYLGRFEWLAEGSIHKEFRIVVEWPATESSTLVLPPKIPTGHPLAKFSIKDASTYTRSSVQGMIFHFEALEQISVEPDIQISGLLVEYENSTGRNSLKVEVPSVVLGFDAEVIIYFIPLLVIILLLFWYRKSRQVKITDTTEKAPNLNDLRKAFDQRNWSRFFEIVERLEIYPFEEFQQEQLVEVAQKYRFVGLHPDARQVEKLGKELNKNNQDNDKIKREEAILREVLED